MEYQIIEHELIFRKPATTSRNVFKTRLVRYVVIRNGAICGIGEASPLSLLSIDDVDDYDQKLVQFCDAIVQGNALDDLDIERYPSIQFGLETALEDLRMGGNRQIFENDFYLGKPIAINGLVWMADLNEMYEEALVKLKSGYKCIKFKVGAHDFDAECRLLEKIRKAYNSWDLEIRLDANGAFSPDEASQQLKDLSRFDIHSIEQPIKPNLWDDLGKLCHEKTIDIALDEELIGVPINQPLIGSRMLQAIKPQYIILKPNLIGGFSKADKWIELARKYSIGWWATSALESNIGLNAIAQWVSTYNPVMPQGLGTGSLFSNNVEGPLEIKNQQIHYSSEQWDLSLFNA